MNGLRQNIEEILAKIREIGSAGAVGAAHEALSAILVDYKVAIQTDYLLCQAVVFTGFCIIDLLSVEWAVALHFPKLSQCKLSVGKSDPPGGQIIIWETASNGVHHFCFSASLFSLNMNESFTIVTRWFACLRIATQYDPTSRVVGRAYLDVGDWSAGLGLCFCDQRPDSLLIPDSSFLSSNGYESARLSFGHYATSWNARQPIAIWRGSSTGPINTSLVDTPRVLLCRIALEAGARNLLDAGITDVVQAATPEEAETIRSSGLCKGYIPMDGLVGYKYQIDIDGNTNSWPGLFQKLLTGSPVLKVRSITNYRQWYYPQLIPWYNYVPVEADMSDLLEIITYLRCHDDKALLIGAAGQRLAAEMTCAVEVERSLKIVEAAFNRGRFVSARTRSSNVLRFYNKTL